jgi:L,D-transpeptidase YcbB
MRLRRLQCSRLDMDSPWHRLQKPSRAHKHGTILILILLLIVPALMAAPPVPATTPEPSVEELLSGRFDAGLGDDGRTLLDPAAVRRFYQWRDYRPAWTGPGCQAAMAALIEVILGADQHGLHPDDYHLHALVGPERCRASRELLATDAWLALAAHLHAGRVDPLTVEPDWTATRPEIDAVVLLERALAQGNVAGELESLAPTHPFYSDLRRDLLRFRDYAQRGNWAGIESGPTLRLDDEGPRVQQLRARLALSGLIQPPDPGDPVESRFDPTLEAALKVFQQRANLEPDGIAGPQTLAQLDRRAADRIAQIRVNLERMRWLPADLGQRHIRVNIADFRLEAWADGRIERVHQVIVGQLYRRTPSFSGTMTHVVLNPWWETPHSLAVRDKLPQFRRSPQDVQRLGFEVLDRNGVRVDAAAIDWHAVPASGFPYRLRQRPGPQNALGRVKFMFPNSHNVYLHDTPGQALFGRVRRDFSSGCIRVEHALDLAEWVLENTPGWSRQRIDAAASGASDVSVLLREIIPVHLLYLTAVADGAGGVRLIDDIYGRDPALIAALDRPPPRAVVQPADRVILPVR